ncbi:MAG: cupin domain-containing protein [Rhodocyclaceae bacterium]|nr:cupin domain-containing protein [Rhodocyclaceae bacterium]
MDTQLLGGIPPDRFLADYWQKKPLLIRGAVPGFKGVISNEALFKLARHADVESRLVRQDTQGWELRHGPQRAADLRRQGAPWTVLVQGVNLWDDAADALMRRFNFIPQARLDDLMVSYAIDGGGVGPHVDDYDVFLLQGQGQRRWQIGQQDDRTLIDDAPLKVLAHFTPSQEWVLDPGDMLYLPPQWAHNGIAIGECTTYSIGFRTPSVHELCTEFLNYLQERLHLDGLYADPELRSQRNSARIPTPMASKVERMTRRLRWRRKDVADFLGHYLSEPKASVFFDPPDTPLGERSFATRIRRDGVRLDRRSILLFQRGRFYLNGERQHVDIPERKRFKLLAHARALPATALTGADTATIALLYGWYVDGFVHPGSDHG